MQTHNNHDSFKTGDVKMHIVALVAADRGRRCLEKILSLAGSEDRVEVFTFKETPWEPPFSQSIVQLAKDAGCQAAVTTKVCMVIHFNIFGMQSLISYL